MRAIFATPETRFPQPKLFAACHLPLLSRHSPLHASGWRSIFYLGWQKLGGILALRIRVVWPQPSPQPLATRHLSLVTLLIAALITCHLSLATALYAQTETATIAGRVSDPLGAVVPNAVLHLVSIDKGTETETKSNGSGIYVIPGVQPGRYRMQVEHDGFKVANLTGLTVNVQENLEENFRLEVGSVSESVTVSAEGININTTDATVSTVVDRRVVENMPLNGRSFQDLILLTPGVVTNSPQTSGALGNNGEFSVNGQRTESNYYTIDGVSANVGIDPTSSGAAGTTGAVAASTALGTTQGLVSVDALQEFRVQSSTYSAEYGRSPGGQISFTTRSGTNQLHGSVFEYLRNNFFDANDWFTNYYSETSAALRQNDFGGTLGGRVEIPHVYNGKDRTFFFLSYEGLRLMQPQPANVSYAPDTALRQSAPAILQPILNAFPVPNGPDLGNGLAEYIGTWSNPSSIDASSIRLDHSVFDKLKLFFRFSDTPSNSATRPSPQGPASGSTTALTSKTYTLGAVSTFSSRLSNDFRLNYTSNGGNTSLQLYQAGGSVPVDLAQLSGIDATANRTYIAIFSLGFPGYIQDIEQANQLGAQHQWNLIDSVSVSLGHHQLSFGGDFRRLTPTIVPPVNEAFFSFPSAAAVESNSGEGIAETYGPAYPLYRNFSAFVQDEWRVTRRLSLSMGLRWEVNPAPGATDGRVPYTVEGSSLSTLALAPAGTPLWQTTWYNFAPRLGVAYVLRSTPGWETVLRTGGGVFFDTGQQVGSPGFIGPGFVADKVYSPASFPLTQALLNVPIVNPPVAPYGTMYAFPQHLQLPYTLQWNGSVQQALGKAQSLTLSYVGSHGSRLLQENEVSVAPFNRNFGTVIFFQNGLTSDYDALQVQFQRNLASGLSVLGSYTWSHCLDYGSQNFGLGYERGNCDFDVRDNFSSAFSYDLPNSYENHLARALLEHWGVDDRFAVRSSFPVTLSGNFILDAATGQYEHGGLNLVTGVPVYLYGRQYPAGRRINPGAFDSPPSGQQGDAPRNFVRGFGAWQMDLATRREFPLYENLRLQFRAEAFNIFNHPNFGVINSTFGNIQFGEATATLANSLGVLNPLYQQGGSRSMQFALKLVF